MIIYFEITISLTFLICFAYIITFIGLTKNIKVLPPDEYLTATVSLVIISIDFGLNSIPFYMIHAIFPAIYVMTMFTFIHILLISKAVPLT